MKKKFVYGPIPPKNTKKSKLGFPSIVGSGAGPRDEDDPSYLGFYAGPVFSAPTEKAKVEVKLPSPPIKVQNN